jgi:type IV pilus assembly protein PilM
MPRKAIGVDIGSRYVKVIEVAREGAPAKRAQARVIAWAAQEIADSSDASKADAVIRAMRAARIRRRRVVANVARADAVVKRIRIPATNRETARRILDFEAQQHVPFPLEETAWDFEDDDKGWVVLAAARRSSLDAVRSILAQAGLRSSAVTVSSDAVATAFLQLAGGAPDQRRDGAAVVIELGAGPIIVNVFRGPTWLLSRPLAVTGDDLTAAFAADLGCDLARAERVRRDEGFGALPAQRPRVMKWLQALRAEVERSLLAAAEQDTALAVERVCATGGGWLTPGLIEATSQALGGAVEVFPALSDTPGPAFGAAVGMGLQGLGLGHGLDVKASAAAETRRQARRTTGSAVTVAALMAVVAVGGWRYWTAEQQGLAHAPARAAAASRAKDMRALQARRDTLETQLAEVQRLLRPRHRLLKALQELSAAAPAGVWLTSVSYTPGRAVSVQGKALSASKVSRLLDALGARAALAHMRQGENEVEFGIAIQAEDGS